MSTKSITIFTPTYNRAYTLRQLYDSLVSQGDGDFEWLIIDDGSTDGTEQLINEFIAEKKLDIRYLRTENGGKHRAINKGVEMARGELFFIVDSDDMLSNDAVGWVKTHYNAVKSDPSFAGVCGLRAHKDGTKIGGEQPFGVLDCTAVELRHKHGIKGDMAEVFRTKVLREFPFPEFRGERFMGEAVVWYRIARRYRMRYFYEKIYICEYLPDGLTHSIHKAFRNSPRGAMLFYATMMRTQPSPRNMLNYLRYLAWRALPPKA